MVTPLIFRMGIDTITRPWNQFEKKSGQGRQELRKQHYCVKKPHIVSFRRLSYKINTKEDEISYASKRNDVWRHFKGRGKEVKRLSTFERRRYAWSLYEHLHVDQMYANLCLTNTYNKMKKG